MNGVKSLQQHRPNLCQSSSVIVSHRRCCPHRSRGTALSASAASPASLLTPPPDAYNHRSATLEATREVVCASYPELIDLVDEGVLFLHQRAADYVERREDGYEEPRLVFVVGTAHVSRRSAADVDRVIRAVRPNSVVVELCKSRSGILFEDDEPAPQDSGRSSSSVNVSPAAVGAAAHDTPSSPSDGTAATISARRRPSSNRGSDLLLAAQRAIRQGGQDGLPLRLLISLVYSRATDSLSVSGGADFRAASAAAEAVGAQLVLGDRPVEVTLGRAWDALTWRRKLALVREVLVGITQQQGLTDAMLEQMKSDDMVSAMMQQMRDTYPELVGPFVTERDMYLAWSLKRSKAVNGNECVVGVVGKGHLRGIAYALSHDSGALRFKDLARRTAANGPDYRPLWIALEVALAVWWLTSWWQASNGGGG